MLPWNTYGRRAINICYKFINAMRIPTLSSLSAICRYPGAAFRRPSLPRDLMAWSRTSCSLSPTARASGALALQCRLRKCQSLPFGRELGEPGCRVRKTPDANHNPLTRPGVENISVSRKGDLIDRATLRTLGRGLPSPAPLEIPQQLGDPLRNRRTVGDESPFPERLAVGRPKPGDLLLECLGKRYVFSDD